MKVNIRISCLTLLDILCFHHNNLIVCPFFCFAFFSFFLFFKLVNWLLNIYSGLLMYHSFPIGNDDSVKLQLKDMALEFSWPIRRIREALSSLAAPSSTPTSCSIESVKSISALVEEQNIPEAKIALASGVSAFLWLYTSIQGYACIIAL